MNEKQPETNEDTMKTKDQRIATLEAIVRDIGGRLDNTERDARFLSTRVGERNEMRCNDLDFAHRQHEILKARLEALDTLTGSTRARTVVLRADLDGLMEDLTSVQWDHDKRIEANVTLAKALEKAHDAHTKRIDTLRTDLDIVESRTHMLETIDTKPVTVDHDANSAAAAILFRDSTIKFIDKMASALDCDADLYSIGEAQRHLIADRDEWKERCEHQEHVIKTLEAVVVRKATKPAHTVYDWRPGDIIAEPHHMAGRVVRCVQHMLIEVDTGRMVVAHSLQIESKANGTQWKPAEDCKPQR